VSQFRRWVCAAPDGDPAALDFGYYFPEGNWWVEADIIFYDLSWTWSVDPAVNPGRQDIQWKRTAY
jgi:hypothetical protein